MSDTTLMERNTAGLRVELRWLPTTRLVVLQCEAGGEQAAVTVQPERALEAFNHPALFLNDAQLKTIFTR